MFLLLRFLCLGNEGVGRLKLALQLGEQGGFVFKGNVDIRHLFAQQFYLGLDFLSIWEE